MSVNGITSSCLHDTCSFNYTVNQTPQVNSLSPNAGTAGTQITLSGSGFSTTPTDNHVTIAGVPINVTASTATTLTCLVGMSVTTRLISYVTVRLLTFL